MSDWDFRLALLAGAGIVIGLLTLVRGFRGYGAATRIADTSSSRIATLAIGEVRISGIVEPAELALVSALQSARCVFFRSSITQASDDGDSTVFREERAVGFRVRDSSGTVRVFPRAAEFDVPDRLDESTGMFGESPPGLLPRVGSAIEAGELSREAQVAALLTVRQAAGSGDPAAGPAFVGGGLVALGGQSRKRHYREARIEPGDVVTVIGQVLPFDQLPDPSMADLGGGDAGPTGALSDPEIAADLAAARAAGTLAATPEEAWGNAAIPGFGIGRPVREPEIDAEADDPAIATAEEAARTERTFQIAPRDLVLAAAADVPLVIALGGPDEAVGRQQSRFLVGLLGAVLAIGSAVAFAVLVGGAARP